MRRVKKTSYYTMDDLFPTYSKVFAEDYPVQCEYFYLHLTSLMWILPRSKSISLVSALLLLS